jgi:hypothetical protein
VWFDCRHHVGAKPKCNIYGVLCFVLAGEVVVWLLESRGVLDVSTSWDGAVRMISTAPEPGTIP